MGLLRLVMGLASDGGFGEFCGGFPMAFGSFFFFFFFFSWWFLWRQFLVFVVVSGGGSEFAGLSEWVCLDVSCREFNPKFPICEKQKNRENTRQRKIITCTR